MAFINPTYGTWSISEEIRRVEMVFLINFLKKAEQFQAIQNIPLTAKLLHSSAENIALYIHHLGSEFEQKQLIKETAKMFYAHLQ